MDNNNLQIDGVNPPVYLEKISSGYESLVYSLSWTAYVRLIWSLLLRSFLFLAAYVLASWVFKFKDDSFMANAGVFMMMVLAVGFTLYDFFYLRTMKVYIDRQGIWLAQGILPWSKGISGSRWDTVGEATFSQTFWSWAFKSYTISVRHRYTGTEDLYVHHVKNGDVAVEDINRLLTSRAV